jgi:vacuolar-type H+-ATPase subunit H
MKRARKRPIKKIEYVTREMLADLRDEIEHVLEDARKEVERARKLAERINKQMIEESTKWEKHVLNDNKRPDRLMETYKEHMKIIQKLQRDVSVMQVMLGLDRRPELAVHSEPVRSSYFHVWIARINERLDRLEGLKHD